MKDALVNLLVFLLVFSAVAALFLGAYAVTLNLVPGGRGLIFANPYAAAQLPALLAGLIAAQYRSVHHPGWFSMTWILQAVAFFLLLTLPFPALLQMPPVRASDESPLREGRFLPLEDGSLLITTKAPVSVLVPYKEGLMTASAVTQYDPLNQRFVFANQAPQAVGTTGPERKYFEYTPSMVSLQSDLLAVHTSLRDSATQNPLLFWAQAATICWLFMGFYLFFALKTWPLVQIMLAAVLVRLALVFLVYALWSVPALVDLWLPGPGNNVVRSWSPVVLIGSAAATLFFMTILSKPHRQAALS